MMTFLCVEQSPTYPLDVSTAVCKSQHALVGDESASRDIEALEAFAVLGNSIDGLLGNAADVCIGLRRWIDNCTNQRVD